MATTSTAIARKQMGATTLNCKWFFDIDTANSATAPVWVGVFGLQEFKPGVEGTSQDSSDFASSWKGSQKTALAWKVEGKLKRAVTDTSPTAYDPGQEALRAKSTLTGVQARCHIRFYEMEPGGPRVEAYEGWGTVDWSDDGGAMDALSTVSFTVNGDGERTPVTHPDTIVV